MTQEMHTPGPWDLDLGEYGQEIPELRATVALVACSQQKGKTGTLAADLYTSTWFRLAKAWAGANASAWYILSAKHGLVKPFHYLAPYDQRLPRGKPERRQEWAQDVADLVDQWLSKDWSYSPEDTEIVMLAGRDYCEPLADILRQAGFHVTEPLRYMGIGLQQRWLKENTPKGEDDASPGV